MALSQAKKIPVIKADRRGIATAAQILRKGGVVAYPTDTVYGLAVDAGNPEAVRRLYATKGRDFRKPVHIIVRSIAEAGKFSRLDGRVVRLWKKFFPGPLTIVLPLAKNLLKHPAWRMLSANTGTIGIRQPRHSQAMSLVRACRHPITTTSANVSDKPATYSPDEIVMQFNGRRRRPDLILDGGHLADRPASTVVSLTASPACILRVGPISKAQLTRVLGEKIQSQSQ